MPLLGSKTALRPTPMSMPHTAGLAGDRSLDGAAIGTLVVVIDRAKNLPNLRSMGKQDPYCALRLGKEAKKTETDKRGGQTPRWDQELRFTVYESMDYRKMKVSVFNEDKRTDLIGECWIDLEGIFRRGGGQNDTWHDLNAKGKFAGSIRIEMTYYDTRPREEPEMDTTDESQSVPSEHPQPQAQRTTGPRQPGVKRRPLPGTVDSSPSSASQQRANSVPVPAGGPRSYHTPPRHEPRHNSVPDIYQDSPDYDQHYTQDQGYEQRPGLPQHSMSEPSYDHGYAASSYGAYHQQPNPHAQAQQDYYELGADVGDEADMPFTDDPQALEAINAGGDYYDHQMPHIAPLRHSKIPEYSQPTPQRPGHPQGPPHSYSAPVLAPYQQVSPVKESASAALHRHGYAASHDQYQNHPSAESEDFEPPPPPPSHRNSAPVVPRAAQRPSPMQVSSGPRRALHHATSSADYTSQQASTQTGYEQLDYAEHEGNYSQVQKSTRRRSAEPPYGNGWQQEPQYPHSSQAYANGSPTPAAGRVQALNPGSRPRPQSMGVSGAPYGKQPPMTSQSTSAVPLYKPRAISPKANPRQSTPPSARKPVRTSPSPAAQIPEESADPAADMFSPDSFAQFNPQLSQAQAPPPSKSPFDDHRAAHPMYRDSNSAEHPRPTSSGTSATNDPPTDSFGRIVRSDGRRVDPSDFLPSSTHAPEPEPKGMDKEKRANIKVNVKTRFGPRDASGLTATPGAAGRQGTPPMRSTPPSSTRATPPQPAIAPRQTPPAYHTTTPPGSVPNSSPLQSLEKNNRWPQKRIPNTSQSPLAPSAPGALNSNYQYNSGLPPPIPGKIPLDASDYPPYQNEYYENADDYYDQNDYSPSYNAPHRQQPAIPASQPRRHHGGAGYQVQPGSSPSTSLSHEISQIDLGPSPSREFQRAAAEEERRYGSGVVGRLRRSRFGA